MRCCGSPVSSVAVIGAGAWGTALALHAHRAGHQVMLWSRTALPGRVSPRLPGHALPAGITLTTVLPGVADVVVLAVPLQHVAAVGRALPGRATVLVCAKGVEAGTGRLPLEIMAEVRPGVAAAVLSGPNFAAEIAAGLPAASVIAATDPALRARLIAMLGTPGFRLYGNDDAVGVQVGGAAKNVIAIAAGAVIGAGIGENARAALITRAVAELARLVVALGGRAETAAGLSGLGDLLLTCTGPASRNFRAGMALGRGEALPTGIGVIEGASTAPALLARAEALDLPICRATAGLLAGQITVDQAMNALMSRPQRDE